MTTNSALSWFELSKLNAGDRVEFVEPWDIFPEALIPAGTQATIKENGLNEIWCAMLVLPDNPTIRDALKEWSGCIHLSWSGLDPGNETEDWHTPSPLKPLA